MSKIMCSKSVETLGADMAPLLVQFWQLIAGGRKPRRADRSVGGTLPVRALRYCEPVSVASANGWYVFLARRFRVKWDGHEIVWHCDGMDDFEPLRSVHYPGFAEAFDAVAPEEARGFAPPFLSASIQPGVMQIWTGCVVRTAPGWSSLVRPVANLARPSGYELYEGVIETDRWFGPLFTNVRLTRIDKTIEFDDDVPFLQVQPIRTEYMTDAFFANHSVGGDFTTFTGEEWQSYTQTVVAPNCSDTRPKGAYARDRRKEAGARERTGDV